MVGLAGSYCAGKNSILPFFTKLDYQVLDMDLIGHEVLEWASKEIRKVFGQGVIGKDGHVDRKALGRLVFHNKKLIRILESLVHPEMKVRAVQALSKNNERRWVINAAILFPMELDKLCDEIVFIKASTCRRFFRALKRDRLSWIEAFRRISSQKNLWSQALSKKADIIVVENRGDLEESLQALRNQWEIRYGRE